MHEGNRHHFRKLLIPTLVVLQVFNGCGGKPLNHSSLVVEKCPALTMVSPEPITLWEDQFSSSELSNLFHNLSAPNFARRGNDYNNKARWVVAGDGQQASAVKIAKGFYLSAGHVPSRMTSRNVNSVHIVDPFTCEEETASAFRTLYPRSDLAVIQTLGRLGNNSNLNLEIDQRLLAPGEKVTFVAIDPIKKTSPETPPVDITVRESHGTVVDISKLTIPENLRHSYPDIFTSTTFFVEGIETVDGSSGGALFTKEGNLGGIFSDFISVHQEDGSEKSIYAFQRLSPEILDDLANQPRRMIN